jgi:hypothetical protein
MQLSGPAREGPNARFWREYRPLEAPDELGRSLEGTPLVEPRAATAPGIRRGSDCCVHPRSATAQTLRKRVLVVNRRMPAILRLRPPAFCRRGERGRFPRQVTVANRLPETLNIIERIPHDERDGNPKAPVPPRCVRPVRHLSRLAGPGCFSVDLGASLWTSRKLRARLPSFRTLGR